MAGAGEPAIEKGQEILIDKGSERGRKARRESEGELAVSADGRGRGGEEREAGDEAREAREDSMR